MAADQLREQRFHRSGDCFRVDVVQDQQPARVLPQPSQYRIALLAFVRLPLFGQVQNRRCAQGGQIALQGLAAVGGHEEQGGVFVGTPPGVFQRESRLADASQAVQHGCNDGRGASCPEHDRAFGSARQAASRGP